MTRKHNGIGKGSESDKYTDRGADASIDEFDGEVDDEEAYKRAAGNLGDANEEIVRQIETVTEEMEDDPRLLDPLTVAAAMMRGGEKAVKGFSEKVVKNITTWTTGYLQTLGKWAVGLDDLEDAGPVSVGSGRDGGLLDLDVPEEETRDRVHYRVSESAQVSDGDAESVADVMEGWDEEGNADAALWQRAEQMTGNTRGAGNRTDADVNEEVMEGVERYTDAVQDALQEEYGDSIPVFQGVQTEDGGQKKGALTAAGEDGATAVVEHDGVESWMLTPEAARSDAGEDGVLVRREIPTDNVLLLGADAGENVNSDLDNAEIVAAMEDEHEYDPDDIVVEPDVEDSARWTGRLMQDLGDRSEE